MRYSAIFLCLVSMLSIHALFAQAPTIIAVDPDTVPVGWTGNVLITGTTFLTGITSDFGSGITVTGTIRLTSTLARASLVVDIGATPGTRDIIVTNPGGEADTLFASFWVVPESDPPTVNLIWPACNETTACIDSAIIIMTHDASGIDPASIRLEVAGIVYDISSPELSVVRESVIVWRPATTFPEGTISIRLLDLADIYSNRITGIPINCSFVVDGRGPVFTFVFPSLTSRDLTPTIYSHVIDSISGADSTSIYFIVNGIRYDWGSASVRWRRDTLFWYSSYAGVTFRLHDVVSVCIGASDRARSCGPNETVFCWNIRIEIPPPTELSFTIESINPANFPLISAYCHVNDEDDRMVEGLDERNFRVWENGHEQYPLIVSSLGGGGQADIVWCIDTTGSMYGLIALVRDNVMAFAESLAISGIDYRLGLVTFADHVNFPRGYDLTPSASLFRSWVSVLGASGGGDWPEVSFDAIVDALAFMRFRPTARKVICMVTDAPYHYRGDGTPFSDVVYADVYSAVMSSDAIAFVLMDTTPSDPTRPYNGVWYGPGSITQESGGAFFEVHTHFDTVLAHIVENIRGGYYVRWTTSHPVATCNLRRTEIEVSMEEFDLEDDDVMDYWAPCSPTSWIIEPHPDTISTHAFPISNRPLQRIIMNLQEIEIEDSVNVSSIQVVVEDRMYTVADPELTYIRPRLIFTPRTPWTHRQMVDVTLARVMDTQGNLPIAGPIRWVWGVDLLPPVASELNPAPNSSVLDPYNPVSFKLFDDFTGVDPQSILFTYTNRQGRSTIPPDVRFLSTTSPGVTWNGVRFTFDPRQAVPRLNNSYLDTICVSILRAYDRPDYVDLDRGPNSLGQVDWCFAVLDDDTICPVFSFIGPRAVQENLGFHIFMLIRDALSGVYDPPGGSDPQGVYLVYDTDGNIDDGWLSMIPMSRVNGDTFRTDIVIPPLDESANFVFAVFACDNDADDGYTEDRSCCWSDTFNIHVIRGPFAEVIYPKNNEVSTNEDQEIAVFIYDSVQGVDPATILFGVNGIDYMVDGAILRFVNDTMFFNPPPTRYFRDGMWVACSLKQVKDFAGDPATPIYWKFFVDLTPPVTHGPASFIPAEGAIVLNLANDVIVELWDVHRVVDRTTIELEMNDSITFIWGDVGMYYDTVGHIFTFRPVERGMQWPNNDSVCLELRSADILPHYGDRNYMAPVRWCFFPSITSCNYFPNPFTPNGDGINEFVSFTYPYMAMSQAIIRVFDLHNNLVFESPRGATRWDGSVIRGGIGSPGLYLFTIEHNGEIICSGTILLIR